MAIAQDNRPEEMTKTYVEAGQVSEEKYKKLSRSIHGFDDVIDRLKRLNLRIEGNPQNMAGEEPIPPSPIETLGSLLLEGPEFVDKKSAEATALITVIEDRLF